MTKELFLKKMEKFENENYEIIKMGEKSQSESVFKCLNCGQVIRHKNEYLFSNKKKYLCTSCNYKRKDTSQNEQRIIKKLSPNQCTNIEFYMQSTYNNIRHHWVRFTCGLCGRMNNKEVSNLLKQKFNCSYCQGGKQAKDTILFEQELREKYGEKFELLTEYKDASTKIRVRCTNCGFIREIKPNALLASGYCVKCDDKNSQGEKIIRAFLEENCIGFEGQKYFKEWGIGIHYFDFYIPSKNLIIEFHGKQHYEFIDFFHNTEEDFLYRCSKDKIKKEKALQEGYNYISIKYSLIKHLPVILQHLFDSTTIPYGSRGKCLEIETIQDLDEDIVCSLSKDKAED